MHIGQLLHLVEKDPKFIHDYDVLPSWLCISVCMAQLDVFNFCIRFLDE